MRFTIYTSVLLISLLAGCANWNVIEKEIRPLVGDPPGAELPALPNAPIVELTAVTGGKFRMGGAKSRGFLYAGSNNLTDVVQTNVPQPGSGTVKAPNELGIYNMSGNAYEYCSDWYNPAYYGTLTGLVSVTHRPGNGQQPRGAGWLV